MEAPAPNQIGTTAGMAAGSLIRGDLEAEDDDAIQFEHIEDLEAAVEKTSPGFKFRVRRLRDHRRRSTRVAAADLFNIRKELGLPDLNTDRVGDVDAVQAPRPAGRASPITAGEDSRRETMTSNGTGMPGFTDNSPNPATMANMSRQTPSPSPQHGMAQANGGGGIGGMAGGLPMNAGHQMDLNNVYEMVVELSDVLKQNREMTRGIINSAEEIMRRSTAEDASPSLQQVNGEISAARIAELERALAKERRLVEVLKREQVENTKLIGEFETAMGTMVEQIRNYCQNNNMQYLAQKRHYNNLLQAERDAHLESRLDRDYWHAQTMRCAEMIRTAYRLRCEEEDLPTRIISGLQNEVRAYRNALGMDPEKPEEEFGWEYLKDLPPSVD